MAKEKKFTNKSVSSTERIFFDESFKTFRLYPGKDFPFCQKVDTRMIFLVLCNYKEIAFMLLVSALS